MDGFSILSQIKTLQDLLLIVGGLAALALTTTIVVFVNSRAAKAKVDGQLRLMQQEERTRREADAAQIKKADQERLLREIELEVQRDKHNNDSLTRFAVAIETSNNIGQQIARAVEGTNDVLKQMRQAQDETKERHEANAVRIAKIDDSLHTGLVLIEGKVDGTRAEVTAQGVNVVQTINNRILEAQTSIKATGDTTHTLVNKLSTTLDSVLLKVNELGTKVAALQDNKDDARYQEVLSKLGELFVFVKSAKRGTDPLDPAKLITDPISLPTITNAIPKAKTGPLPQTAQLTDPTPTITPVVQIDISRPVTGTFATPTSTGHADTQPIEITPKGDTPNA